MTPDDLTSLLYGVADDAEASVLDELLIRAKLTWRCECGWTNDDSDELCDTCGAERDERKRGWDVTVEAQVHAEKHAAKKYLEALASDEEVAALSYWFDRLPGWSYSDLSARDDVWSLGRLAARRVLNIDEDVVCRAYSDLVGSASDVMAR